MEIACHDMVHQREVAKVGEKHIQLHDIGKAAARRLGDGPEVVEHAPDLRLHIALHQIHRLRDQRDLPRQVNGIACLDGLGISADGLGALSVWMISRVIVIDIQK